MGGLVDLSSRISCICRCLGDYRRRTGSAAEESGTGWAEAESRSSELLIGNIDMRKR